MKFWRGNRYFLKYGKREFLLGSYHKISNGEYLSVKGSAHNGNFSVFASQNLAQQNIEKNFSNVTGRSMWKSSSLHECYWCGDFAMAFIGEYTGEYEANLFSCNKSLEEPKPRKFKTMHEAKSFVEKYIG